MGVEEHYLTDYRTVSGIRVVVYVPTTVPQVQPNEVLDPILHGMIRLADVVQESLSEL